MTPDQFINKRQGVTLKERSAAQEHFLDLCRLLDEPTPAESDSHGERYCFEKGAKKAGGGDRWADVWKRARYGWEYKGPGKDLQQALKQLQIYTPALAPVGWVERSETHPRNWARIRWTVSKPADP